MSIIQSEVINISNKLKNETSPYLLEHAENPVNWYPWCEEAFVRAQQEDKPVFLSIGYSCCHWCHVMARESFEDPEVSKLLNREFICVKVDREERPDIDNVYMSVCVALTGSGGWPMSIFMTAEQKPFFAGTYFPKNGTRTSAGFLQVLNAVADSWHNNRDELIRYADDMVRQLSQRKQTTQREDEDLADRAVAELSDCYDRCCGGFGPAPKFPAAHRLLFLMEYYRTSFDKHALQMAKHTLTQLYRGGIFDHIGGGFSRYSTDKYFLVPHFEKMLYDNALLTQAYARAYEITKKPLYLKAAKRTADYILRELTSPEGGFYSAQDADTDGEEGKYYLLEPEEVIRVLGWDDGEKFNAHFGITKSGNFNGASIPNLLNSPPEDETFEKHLSPLYEYRRSRASLRTDDKVLTAWCALTVAALVTLYRVCGCDKYLQAAQRAQEFIEKYLTDGHALFVSYRDGRRGARGYLDDYAYYIYALLSLYEATAREEYFDKAQGWCNKAVADYYDALGGGFFFCGKENERLIISPRETEDGAMMSGNSVMAYNLVLLSLITKNEGQRDLAQKQLAFMSARAQEYPSSHCFFLCALSLYKNPPPQITVVLADSSERAGLREKLGGEAIISVFDSPREQYPMINGKTTYYVCRGGTCLPPTNDI